MKSRKYIPKKASLTKKYLKNFLERLEYIQYEVYEGSSIEYPNNFMLAYLMDIEYNDELIDKAINELERQRAIVHIIRQDSKLKPPFCHLIDIIPF